MPTKRKVLAGAGDTITNAQLLLLPQRAFFHNGYVVVYVYVEDTTLLGLPADWLTAGSDNCVSERISNRNSALVYCVCAS